MEVAGAAGYLVHLPGLGEVVGYYDGVGGASGCGGVDDGVVDDFVGQVGEHGAGDDSGGVDDLGGVKHQGAQERPLSALEGSCGCFIVLHGLKPPCGVLSPIGRLFS